MQYCTQVVLITIIQCGVTEPPTLWLVKGRLKKTESYITIIKSSISTGWDINLMKHKKYLRRVYALSISMYVPLSIKRCEPRICKKRGTFFILWLVSSLSFIYILTNKLTPNWQNVSRQAVRLYLLSYTQRTN